MLLGLVAQALIAAFFGTGQDSDALFMARDIADLAAKFLIPAQAAGVLLPLYVSVRTRAGDENAWRASAAILALVALVALPLVVVAVALAPVLVSLLAPGFDDDAQDLTANLLRLVAPTLWFTVMAGLAAALLQGKERFGAAMGANAAGAAALVAALPPLVHFMDVEGAALAMVTGAAVQCLAAWALLVRDGMPPLVLPWRRRDEVREFVSHAGPFYVFVLAGQASGAALRIAASTLATGLYAAFSLAFRLHRAALSLMLTPVQYVLLPALAASEASERRADADNELVATLRQVVFLFVPLVALLVVLREPVVSALYERGDFGADATDDTSAVLGALALATLPTAMQTLLEQAAYARRRSRLVVRTNVAVEITQGALYFPLVALLGAPGIALAFVAATGLGTVAYLAGLRPATERRRGAHLGFLAAVAACCAALVLAALGAREAAEALLDPQGGLAQLAVIVPAALAGGAAYLVAAALLRIREPAVLGASLRELLGAGLARARRGTHPAPAP